MLHRLSLTALVVLAFVFTSQVRADLVGGVNNNSLDGNDVYVVVPGGLDEDVNAFIDRTHQWNGDGAGGPTGGSTLADLGLVGADYLMTANDDKAAPNLTIDLTFDGVANDVYLFLDNRVDDGNRQTDPPGNIMPWISDLGFVDTGFDVGVDEGGDGIGPGAGINQSSSVFLLANFTGRTLTLLEQNNGGGRNMYGVAVIESLIPEPSTFVLAGLGLLGLAGGARRSRRR